MAAAWVRFDAPSLVMIRDTCTLNVFGEMQVQSVNRPEFLYAAPTAPNLARERQRGS